MPDQLPHSLRSDARDNRQRILEAARAVFAAEGLDAPLRRIARAAEVGPATLYRHFPTKEILATAALEDEMSNCNAAIDAALADPDAWRGFCGLVERIFEQHALNRGFSTAFTTSLPGSADFASDRRRALVGLIELIRRAKAAGALRADFALDDLFLMLMAHRGIRVASPAAGLAASRRYGALALQAFRASPTTVPLPPVPRLAAAP